MADVLDVACPNCGKALRVPANLAGKKVKCKGCLEAFVVKPAAAKAAAQPAPAADSGAKPAAAAQANPNQRVTWDEAADTDDAPVGVIKEDETPRCPHCAKELDPPDAVICVNCGFNNRTRVKADTKKVIGATGGDWTMHLLPGVLAFVGVVTFVVLDFVVTLNMRYWMEDGMLESDELGPDGRKKMLVSPGLFIMTTIFFSIAVSVPLIKIAYRRLFVNYLPPEELMK